MKTASLFTALAFGLSVSSSGPACAEEDRITISDDIDFTQVCEEPPLDMDIDTFIALHNMARDLDRDNGLPHHIDIQPRPVYIAGDSPWSGLPRYILLRIRDGDTRETALESHVLYDTQLHRVNDDTHGYHLPSLRPVWKNALCYISAPAYGCIAQGRRFGITGCE